MAKIEILRGKALDKHIEKIGKTAGSLKTWIHQAAISAAVHALEHGNCTPLNKLCEHAEFVTHNNAVKRWAHEYVKYVRYDTKEKGFIMNTELRKASCDKDGKVLANDLAHFTEDLFKAAPYYEFAPPPAFVAVNIASLLKSALTKAEKADKADPRNKLDGIEDLKKLVAKLKVAA